jgi:hypothetical protein
MVLKRMAANSYLRRGTVQTDSPALRIRVEQRGTRFQQVLLDCFQDLARRRRRASSNVDRVHVRRRQRCRHSGTKTDERNGPSGNSLELGTAARCAQTGFKIFLGRHGSAELKPAASLCVCHWQCSFFEQSLTDAASWLTAKHFSVLGRDR